MKALITGISGQDGSYLAELLLSEGYEVHGCVLPEELVNPKKYLWRLTGIINKITLYPAKIESFTTLQKIVQKVNPDECYHLAAFSFVSYSFEDEFNLFRINIDGTHNILAALKESSAHCKFYFAGSSELFGNALSQPQNEDTPFHPRSSYGITKTTGYHLTSYYRQQHGMFACNGIAFNHESVRRGNEYVTRKITQKAAEIKMGNSHTLTLGNLEARRDWGYAPDYVRAMWLMLQQDNPEDYVIATGKLHTVRDICQIAFEYLGLNYHDHVNVASKFFRPEEEVPLVGDATKIRTKLNWKSEMSFSDMIVEMVEFDLYEIRNG